MAMAMNTGFLKVVSPDELADNERRDAEARAARRRERPEHTYREAVRHFLWDQWEMMRNHRQSSGLGARMLAAMRVYDGRYSPAQLQEIRNFGGSEVFARIVANKARGATSLLRDVFFAQQRTWEVGPTPEPSIRDDVISTIDELVMMEAEAMMQAGMPIDQKVIADRKQALMTAARRAAEKLAAQEAREATTKMDDRLREGGFYVALAELLVDLPIFPFAVIKGPVVRIVDQVKWVDKQPQLVQAPQLQWERVSPFDIYFTPGASTIAQADIIQRHRWTTMDLTQLLSVPTFDEDEVRAAIAEFEDGGHRDWTDSYDEDRAVMEGRESTSWNRSHFIDALEYHGAVPARTLHRLGVPAEDAPDPDRTYMVEMWMCGSHLLKLSVNDTPRRRVPYSIVSFEQVPGTLVGNGLTDILADVQQVANGALRALVNNMAMASGPQVVVLENRFSEAQETMDIYPWKRWRMVDEPGQGALPPVQFYQPNSNATELLGVYQKMTELADEISAIPRYLTGSGAPGGAGRTASGLNMLMGNASKMLQQVCHNIDTMVVEPTLQALYDLLLMTDSLGEMSGDERIVVRGASVVNAREAERSRMLEFLQLTGNPMDMQILGVQGRAKLLREIARHIGIQGVELVPSEEELIAREQQQAQQMAQQGPAGAQGQPQGKPSTPPQQMNSVQRRNMQPGGQ